MKTANRAAGRLAAPGARVAAALSPTTNLTMLGWHRIADVGGGLSTSEDDFKRHLDVIEEWGATVLDLDEAHRLQQLGQLPERALVLTFDDGYASVVERAWPELKRRGMPATLYAVSGYLEGGQRFPWDHRHAADDDVIRLLTAAELRDAADDGLDIGSHTVTHRWLPGLTIEEVREEVVGSRAALEDLLQRPVVSFSYPMGGKDDAIREEVRRAGYSHAVTTERGRNRPSQDPLRLRRPFAFDDPADLRRQLDGAYTWMRFVERARAGREPQW